MSDFTGTLALARAGLRRDRVLAPVWVAVFTATAAVSSTATVDLYPDGTARAGAAAAINTSSALVALYGRVYGSSTGAVSMIKMGGFGSVCVALLAVVLVVRHTRAEEESGRLELVAATPVGRLAPLCAALVVASTVSMVLGATTAAALAATGLPAAGSVAFGAAWAGAGLCFAAVAAVVAQVATTARATTAACAALLAAVYAVRAVGDVASTGALSWLTWLSPIGWAQQFRPYAGNRWWVLAVMLSFTLLATGAAVALAHARDLGAGLFGDRPGPVHAAPGLSSPLALAWRLHRGALVGWTVGFLLLGALVGGIASNVTDFLNNPSAREFITRLGGRQGLVDAFLAVELSFAGIGAAAYGISAALRLRTEEAAGRAVPVLATPTSRTRWATGHVAIALGGTAWLLAVAGVGAGAVRAVQTGDVGQLGRLLGAAAGQLPAAGVLVAVVVLLFGLSARAAVAGWAALVGCILLGELGPLLTLPQWLMDLSPFTHSPRLPGGPAPAAPLVVMTLLAGLLLLAGGAALRRRDVG